MQNAAVNLKKKNHSVFIILFGPWGVYEEK